jgi:hypothetical protein
MCGVWRPRAITAISKEGARLAKRWSTDCRSSMMRRRVLLGGVGHVAGAPVADRPPYAGRSATETSCPGGGYGSWLAGACGVGAWRDFASVQRTSMTSQRNCGVCGGVRLRIPGRREAAVGASTVSWIASVLMCVCQAGVSPSRAPRRPHTQRLHVSKRGGSRAAPEWGRRRRSGV